MANNFLRWFDDARGTARAVRTWKALPKEDRSAFVAVLRNVLWTRLGKNGRGTEHPLTRALVAALHLLEAFQ